jgi:hypothetical protein
LSESACSSGSCTAIARLKLGKHILQNFAFQNTLVRNPLNVAIRTRLQVDHSVGKAMPFKQSKTRVLSLPRTLLSTCRHDSLQQMQNTDGQAAVPARFQK